MEHKRKIIRIITCVTKEKVIIGAEELRHAQEHFSIPDSILLELIEVVLKDPTVIFVDDLKTPKVYRLFYRLENKKYLCVVVKTINDECFFCTMYPTGTSIRNAHKNLKRITL